MEVENNSSRVWLEKQEPKALLYFCKFNNCKRSYRNYASYIRHGKVHEGMQHPCPRCPASFVAKNYLTQHLKRSKSCLFGLPPVARTMGDTKGKAKRVVCKVEGCGKEMSRSNYRKHLDYHEGIKRPCPTCGKEFANLNPHKRRCLLVSGGGGGGGGGGEERKGLECKSCHAVFLCALALEVHTCKNISLAYEIYFEKGQDTFELPSSLEENSSSSASSCENGLSSSSSNSPGNEECSIDIKDELVDVAACEKQETGEVTEQREERADDNPAEVLGDICEGLLHFENESISVVPAEEGLPSQDPLQELLMCRREYNERLVKILNYYK